jgi:hypothetical protein
VNRIVGVPEEGDASFGHEDESTMFLRKLATAHGTITQNQDHHHH